MMLENIELADGNKLPILSFGTFLLKGDECIEAVYNAIKIGYRAIDTAASYQNEAEVGFAIQKAIFDGIVTREDLFISTKLNHHVVGSYEDTKEQFKNSLTLLGLDYLDLYMIHYPNVTPDERWKRLNAEHWRAFEEFQVEGKVKSLGVSNFMIVHLEELFKTAKIKPVYNQLNLSPQWPQNDVVRFCKEHNILPVAWSTFLRPTEYNTPLLSELSEKYKKSPAQISLRWAIQKGYGVISKSSKEDRIKENFNVFDFNIESDDVAKLDELVCYPFAECYPHATYVIWRGYEALQNKDVVACEKFMLFYFIPLFKIKVKGNQKTWNLFTILPIIRTKDFNENGVCIYLFGFIKIAKIKREMKFFEPLKLVPKWDATSSKRKEDKWNPLKEKMYDRIVLFTQLWEKKNVNNKLYRIYLKLRYFFTKKVSIPSLDVHLTTHCTLKCKDCSHMIPYYKKENHHIMSFEEFKENLDIILNSVDRIYNLFLLDGEPLLNKELDKMLDYASIKKQIINVRIITNGTIVPNEKIIDILKARKNTSVLLSNYAANKSIKIIKNKEIFDLFDKEGINYYYEGKLKWSRQPEVSLLNTTKNLVELKNNYKKCDFKKCTCLSNNKIYPCALSKYIDDELNHKYDENFINLTSDKNLRKKFIEFFEKDCFQVCECCDFTNYGKVIFPAMQVGGDFKNVK